MNTLRMMRPCREVHRELCLEAEVNLVHVVHLVEHHGDLHLGGLVDLVGGVVADGDGRVEQRAEVFDEVPCRRVTENKRSNRGRA